MCVCVGVCVGVCGVVYVLRVCVGCAFCVLVFWCCGVLCCVVCVWCVVCVCVVWRGLARGKAPVCRFKKSPCVGSKGLRVYRQNARMCSTCARLARTHGGLLNLHTGGLSLSLSLFLSSFLISLVLSSFSLLSFSSFVLFSFSFSALFSLVFPLSNDDNGHSSSRLSLSLYNTALTCLSVRVRGLWPILCWLNMFASCKKQLSWHSCANLVPLGMKWACICAGNG